MRAEALVFACLLALVSAKPTVSPTALTASLSAADATPDDVFSCLPTSKYTLHVTPKVLPIFICRSGSRDVSFVLAADAYPASHHPGQPLRIVLEHQTLDEVATRHGLVRQKRQWGGGGFGGSGSSANAQSFSGGFGGGNGGGPFGGGPFGGGGGGFGFSGSAAQSSSFGNGGGFGFGR